MDSVSTTPAPVASEHSARSLLWAYGMLNACLMAGYGALFTVVGDFRSAYGIADSTVGLIIGSGFVAGFVAQITIAPIADRGRARQMVLAAVAVNMVGMLAIGFGTSASVIMAGRVISGLAIGSAQPSIRRIVVLNDPDRVGHNLGRLMASGVFGFSMGPAISALLVGPFGLAAPFVVIAVLSVLALSLTFTVPVEETPAERQTKRLLAVDLLTSRPLQGAIALGAAVYVMIGGFDTLWDVVNEDLGTPDWLANLGITLFALPLLLLAAKGGRLAQEIGPFLLAGAGLLVAMVFMTSYGLVPSGNWMFGVVLVHAVTDGLTLASAGVAVAMSAPDDRQAGAQGLLGAGQAISAGITAVMVGIVYETWGRAPAYLTTVTLMAILVAIGMTLSRSMWRDDLADRLRRSRP